MDTRNETSVPVQRFEVWPHRSLGRRGVVVLLGGLAAGLALIVLRCPAPALFPISVGCTLTFATMVLALWASFRSARHGQRIEIGPGTVRVERFGPATMPASSEFATHWVRIVVTEDREVSHRLALVQSGRRVSIGEFLSPEERLALADALRDALARARTMAVPSSASELASKFLPGPQH